MVSRHDDDGGGDGGVGGDDGGGGGGFHDGGNAGATAECSKLYSECHVPKNLLE